MHINHVSNADGKGWLICKWENGSTFPALPQFLRVDLTKTENGRDYFTVIEGVNAGKKGSVTRKPDGSSYLKHGDPALALGNIKYDPQLGIIRLRLDAPVGGWGDAIQVTMDPSNPLGSGSYSIEIPDEVHALGAPYQSQSIYSTTWFRVGNSGDRYLHAGNISAGCVTVTEVSEWTNIYNYLIARRKGDGKSVAVLEISS
jgi:hypothetical protein